MSSSSPSGFTFLPVLSASDSPQRNDNHNNSTSITREEKKKRKRQKEEENGTPQQQQLTSSLLPSIQNNNNNSKTLGSSSSSPPNNNNNNNNAMIVIEADEDDHKKLSNIPGNENHRHQQCSSSAAASSSTLHENTNQEEDGAEENNNNNINSKNNKHRFITSQNNLNNRNKILAMLSIQNNNSNNAMVGRANSSNNNNNNKRKHGNTLSSSTPQPSSHHQQRITIMDEESYKFMSKTPELDPYVREHHFAAQQQQKRKNQFQDETDQQQQDFTFPASLISNSNNNNNNQNQQFSNPAAIPLSSSVSRMISDSQFSADEFYILRLLVSGDTIKTQKLPLQLPHVDLSWMRPLFKTKDGNPPQRSDVERTLAECAKKNILTLNLDCLADDARDFGPDALTPILINSPRSAIVLLRNGIAVTKLLARPPAYYTTDRASLGAGGGRRNPDRLLLHLRKQRADEVRSHLVSSVASQYRQLCRNISPVDAILACCPPKQDDPDVIVEDQLAKEIDQLEKLKNRTTMAVSRSVREQRELEEKIVARQQRSEICELHCRERLNAKVETLKDRAEKRAEKLKDVRARAVTETKEVLEEFRQIEQDRQEKQLKFLEKQREDQESRHLKTMKRLREAQDAHQMVTVVTKRKREAKVNAKTEKIINIRDERDAEAELRKLDFSELDRMREEAKDRAKEGILEFRRRAAQRVLAAAQQSDEAELRLARKRNRIKAIGEIEEEKRQDVLDRARKNHERRQARLETKFTDDQVEMAERAMVRSEIAKVNAAERAAENAERMEAHDMSSQQQAFQKLLAIASLARKEDAANVQVQRKKLMDESGQWIRDVARHHFEEQRKRITEMAKAQK